MSTFLMTNRSNLYGRRSMHRLRGPNVRTIADTSTPAVDVRTPMSAANVQSSPASVFVGRDHDSERLDAVAGAEFVDDRIRLNE
jgi:hypothetical protein